jgi:hypothetical protein
MKDWAAILTNISGTFPNVVAVNSTTPSTPDGTEFIKAYIDDGTFSDQANINHAGMTPNGSTDNATGTGATGSSAGSQRLVAMQKICGAPGEVVAWMGNNADPSLGGGGFGRILPLVGQVLAHANYPDLLAATYVGDPDNGTAPAFYKVDSAGWPSSGSRNTAGAYLVLPDSRGYFLRGLDTGATVDPDGGGRAVGDNQAAAVGDHTHKGTYGLNNETGTTFGEETAANWRGGAVTRAIITDAGSPNNYTGFATQRTDGSIIRTSDNRPVNMGVYWCIRY